MIVNGVELPDLDRYDLEVVKKQEKMMEDLKKVSEQVKGLKESASIEKQCQAIFEAFNTLFGPGTDKKVFGDKVNLRICFKAFDELCTSFREEKDEDREFNEIINKYSSNRAQRRAKK